MEEVVVLRELRYGTEIDIGYEPGYRFSVRLTDDRKFQPYVRDLRVQKDIPGPTFEYCLPAEDFAEVWRADYILTKNIHCIEKAKV